MMKRECLEGTSKKIFTQSAPRKNKIQYYLCDLASRARHASKARRAGLREAQHYLTNSPLHES